MKFREQCKGKDLDKVAKSKLDTGLYLCSTKYDGNYVQIHKFGNEVKFFSSGGIEFRLWDLEVELIKLNPNVNFIVEAEYIGYTDGSLGSRGECTTTTYRTRTAKGFDNVDLGDIKFKVFDIIHYENVEITYPIDYILSSKFTDRLELFKSIDLGSNLELVEFSTLALEDAVVRAKYEVSMGGEGLFGKKGTHLIKDGKRVNDAIKIKFYPQKTLEFVGIKPGQGKYNGMIGSLILIDEERNDELVYISGMSDELRRKSPDFFIGKKVKFEYESFNKTYVQARFLELI